MDSTSTIRTEKVRSEHQPENLTGTDCPSSSGINSGSISNQLATLYGPILEPLATVERRLHGELQSPYESIVPLLRHGTQLGGKRLRPAMLLLTADAVNEITQDHIVLGTVIEMVHTATLIHDDVLDDAKTRRHQETL